jgi:hypothetical protein
LIPQNTPTIISFPISSIFHLFCCCLFFCLFVSPLSFYLSVIFSMRFSNAIYGYMGQFIPSLSGSYYSLPPNQLQIKQLVYFSPNPKQNSQITFPKRTP